MPRYCPDCGRENPDSETVCINCSMSLSPFGTREMKLLSERYLVTEIIKSGAMGCVFKGRDLRLNNVAAIKKMHSFHTDPVTKKYAEERFMEEGRLLSLLHHGSLPKVIDFFIETDPGTGRTSHYLVMTFIEGRDLETIISERDHRLFSVEEALDYFCQILDILHYLHSRNPPVIYRDLNPRNIMINEGKVFLVDFGIARIFKPQVKGSAIGTPGYSPPEQYKGTAEPRSDLYSLAVVMHYLLTGKNPEDSASELFNFEKIRNINRDAPEYLEALIASMLDLVPDNRPSGADVVKAVIQTRDPKVLVKASQNAVSGYSGIITASSLGRIGSTPLKLKQYALILGMCTALILTFFFTFIFLDLSHNRKSVMKTPNGSGKSPSGTEPEINSSPSGQFTRPSNTPESMEDPEKKWRSYRTCMGNLKRIAVAIELYSVDCCGRYPFSLSALTPVYIPMIPPCPAAGYDTYSSTYRYNPDHYFFMCSGTHHAEARVPENFPEYDSFRGVIENSPTP